MSRVMRPVFRSRLGLVLCVLLGCGVACGDADETTDPPANNAPNNDPNNTPNNQPNNAPAAGAVFLTYNVGLARGFVDFAEERAEPLANAVAAADADVICLQEVWDDDFIELMTTTAQTNFPHSFVQKTESDEMVAGCTDEEIEPLETCARENCDGIEPGELAGCVLEACGDEFSSTSTECQGCAAAQLGNPLDVIIDNCRGGGPAFSYGGHNGLVILSRHPLSNTDHEEFPSSLVFRAVLHATVDHPDLGQTDVYCTHLAADLSGSIDYNGEFESFAGEQAQQIDDMGEFIAESQVSDRAVLLGDFNTGPDGGQCTSELPENFQKIVALGFSSPYVEQDAPACTFQENNTLVGGAGDGGELLDHVFLNGPGTDKVSEIKRSFEELVTITTGDGDIEVNLSDHFGVQLRLAP